MRRRGVLNADALIFDLEDSVAPDAKVAARNQIAAALRTGGYGKRELILRVNGADTSWQDDDLRFAKTLPVDAVLLPKVTGADDVLAAEAVLAGPGMEQRKMLWCMMEVPRAFLHADAIASASPRIAALVMGTEDLGKDLRTRPMPDRAPLVTAIQLCVLAARAYGLDPLDSVLPDFNIRCLRGGVSPGPRFRFCRQDADPSRSDRAGEDEAFAPSADEIAAARRVVEAYAAAKAQGRSVASLDGRMIEQLHATDAQQTLDMAAAIDALNAA